MAIGPLKKNAQKNESKEASEDNAPKVISPEVNNDSSHLTISSAESSAPSTDSSTASSADPSLTSLADSSKEQLAESSNSSEPLRLIYAPISAPTDPQPLALTLVKTPSADPPSASPSSAEPSSPESSPLRLVSTAQASAVSSETTPSEDQAASSEAPPPNEPLPKQRSKEIEAESNSVFLFGKTRSGKSAVFGALYKAVNGAPHERCLTLHPETQETHAAFEGMHESLIKDKVPVLATRSATRYCVSIRDKSTTPERVMKIDMHDNVGGWVFESDIYTDINEGGIREQRAEMIKNAQNADTIVMCVNSNELDPNFYEVTLQRRLREFTTKINAQGLPTLKCSRFLIVLTKIDLLADVAAQAMREEVRGLLNLSTFDADPDITPLSVVEWIDTVELCKRIIGNQSLRDIMNYLNPEAELAVLGCSPFGFTSGGLLIANEEGSFNTSVIPNRDSQSLFDLWKPHNVLSIINYLFDREDPAIRKITKDVIEQVIVNDDSGELCSSFNLGAIELPEL